MLKIAILISSNNNKLQWRTLCLLYIFYELVFHKLACFCCKEILGPAIHPTFPSKYLCCVFLKCLGSCIWLFNLRKLKGCFIRSLHSTNVYGWKTEYLLLSTFHCNVVLLCMSCVKLLAHVTHQASVTTSKLVHVLFNEPSPLWALSWMLQQCQIVITVFKCLLSISLISTIKNSSWNNTGLGLTF